MQSISGLQTAAALNLLRQLLFQFSTQAAGKVRNDEDAAALLLSLLIFVVGLRQNMLLCIMHKPRHLMWILSGVYVGCSATFIELPSSPAAAAAAGSHLASSIEKLCAYLCVCVFVCVTQAAADNLWLAVA